MEILTWEDVLDLIKRDEVKCSMSITEIEHWVIKNSYRCKKIHRQEDLDEDGLAETYIGDYTFIIVYTDGKLDAVIYAYEPMNPRIFVDTVLIPDDDDVKCYNKKLRIFG